MKTTPVGEAGKTLSAIVNSRKATMVSVLGHIRAAVIPAPPEAADTPYEVVELSPGVWTMRPVAL